MEIGAVSASWTDTLQTLEAWRRQRLDHGLFVPAAFALAVASTVGQELPWWAVLRLPVAWTALAALRLWDDLEDREADRRAHPERVWLGDAAGRLGGLVAAGLLGVACWMPGVLVLAGAVLLFYRLRPSRLEVVLLLKYPVLVGLLRGSLDAPGLAAMLLVYGGMLLDSDIRGPGWTALWTATLALAWMAPLPVGGVVLAVGLALPWVKPVRPGVLAGVVVQLLALRLGMP
jgi:hypothetical protein